MSGYQGRILEIDLDKGSIEVMSLDEGVLRDYIGGSGLAAKLFLDRVSPEVNPLSAENQLFVLTGPLTGTNLPGTGRFVMAAKSPLTGIWGEANCGGHFGPQLKFAGYDGVIVKGTSKSPVYISIEDETVEVRDASDIWGKDV